MGFIPDRNIDAALESYNWDIHSFEFRPSSKVELDDESKRAEIRYGRYGFPEFGIEPFVVERSFHGLKQRTIEVSEQYRLFHNLYFDKPNSAFLKFDDAGNEIPVFGSRNTVLKPRRKEIRQFLSAKNMSLVIYYEQMNASIYALDELAVTEHQQVERSNLFTYWFLVEDCRGMEIDSYRSRSWILGKSIVTGTTENANPNWPYENIDYQHHEEFIIGIDENDEPIRCSPQGIRHTQTKKVSDSLGNKVVARYLTPLFFNQAVLSKYRSEPSKYVIEDGLLRCSGLWALRMDNNHENFVIVFLGRLNDDLPVSEQTHWKHHNVPPEGGLSRPAYRRNVLGEWADPEDSALRFQIAFERLSESWHKHFDWALFKPLADADLYHFKTLHRPATREPFELDKIAVSLSKLLVEAINTEKLKGNYHVL